MDLTDMLEENKTKKRIDTGKYLKDIFKNNWKEIFIIDGVKGNVFSYQDFFGVMLRYKEKLEKIGLKKGDIICLMMSNSIETVALYFASLLMQLIVVPIDINKGEDEIKETLSQVKYKTIISNVSGLDFLPHEKIEIEDFHEILYERGKVDIDEVDIFDDIDYDKIFLITFTSGSTGMPKGVMHSFNNLVLSALAFRKKFNFGREHIFYHNLPMAYMAGILNLIILPFVSESKIVIGERFGISSIMRFWDIPVKYSVNVFWFIPTIVTLLLKFDRGNKGIDYAHKTKIIGCVGTAHLNRQAKITFQKRYKIPLYESYGLSETLFVTTESPNEPKIEDSVGKVLEGVNLAFCEDGEIAINVPWMFLGYINDEAERYFKDGKYLSGDIGKIDKNGVLTITGRKKDLIIRGGMNISPKRIEDFISMFEIFEESVILGFEDFNLGEKIVCFFVPRVGVYNEDKKKMLNQKIIERLGKDYQIDEYVKLDEIPRNINGKIDKLRIREMYKVKMNDHRN
jgi:long-chain acyl-CoA synthetase